MRSRVRATAFERADMRYIRLESTASGASAVFMVQIVTRILSASQAPRSSLPVNAVIVVSYLRRVLEATIEELRSAALDATDARGYFAAMHARVTDRVRTAINDGRFGDGQRMERFSRTFAG